MEPHDQETIAAFLDRRLTPEDRRAFMRRLDEDEALYEVFVETARYRDRQTGRPATVMPHPASRAGWLGPAAVAAVLAIGLATAVLLQGSGARPAELLVAGGRFDPAPGAAWLDQGWSVTRGISARLPEADAAFRTGVRALELEVALRLGRDADAFLLARRLESTLAALDFSEPLQASYGRLAERLDQQAPRAELLPLAEEAEAAFTEQYPDLAPAFRLGGWAETGRLAAHSGNRQLLGSRSFARTLRRLRQGEWSPEVAEGLATVAALLEAPAQAMDLEALQAAFTAVLDEG